MILLPRADVQAAGRSVAFRLLTAAIQGGQAHPERWPHTLSGPPPVFEPRTPKSFAETIAMSDQQHEEQQFGHTQPGRVAIVGDGQMGLVCACILDAQGISSTLWGYFADYMHNVMQTRVSPRYLPDIRLPETVRLTADDDRIFRDATLIVNAVPTQHIRSAFGRLREHVPAGVPIVSVAKGIETDTLLRPSEVLADVLNDDPDQAARSYAALSGPTIAKELARCLPATMIAASDDINLARTVQTAFNTEWLRIYTHTDMLGVELAGAMKNVIAIAAGIVDGLQAGFNAKSALLARGLAEITRLGVAMGATQETFFGIAGVGDLATTCFSPIGRNRSCGEQLGKGMKLQEIIESSDSVVEGVPTSKAVMILAEKYGVEMPIAAAVHAVLFEGLDPIDGITRLMSREPKAEHIG